MLPQGSEYTTRFSGAGGSSSSGGSVSYDYSGLDEIRKRQNEANQLAVARQAQLYDGDIKGSMTGGQRIRYLLSSLSDIEPVRVSSVSKNNSSSDSGPTYEAGVKTPAEPPVTSRGGGAKTAAPPAPAQKPLAQTLPARNPPPVKRNGQFIAPDTHTIDEPPRPRRRTLEEDGPMYLA